MSAGSGAGTSSLYVGTITLVDVLNITLCQVPGNAAWAERPGPWFQRDQDPPSALPLRLNICPRLHHNRDHKSYHDGHDGCRPNRLHCLQRVPGNQAQEA